MNKETVLKIAQEYMKNKKVDVVLPGQIGKKDGDRTEVIFLIPDAIDPEVALVHPPDSRVWVNVKTREVTWITQM